MIDNLKTDIIYYCTETDFEMEFNLCGCCRMRLLTDKADSRNSLSQLLSKAVTRSQIVILCGSLFGEKNLIDTISVLTGIGTEIVDNSKYGLTSNTEITILKGSVPLITSDKAFGGCIIEQNSQTIIILSESKPLRKQVMTQLVHSYISDVSKLPVSQNEEIVPLDIEKDAFVKTEEDSEPTEETIEPIVEPIVEPIIEPVVAEPIVENTKTNISAQETVDEEKTQPIIDEEPCETKEEPIAKPTVSTEETMAEETKEEIPETATDDDFYFAEAETEEINIIKVEPELEDLPQEKFADLYITSYEEPQEEAEEAPEEKGKFKGAIIALLVVLGLIVLALIYIIVLRPIINGENLSEYVKNLFYESATSELAVRYLH